MTSTRANAVDKSNEQSLNRFDDWTVALPGALRCDRLQPPSFQVLSIYA